jgi:hypothetical protein
MPDGDAMRPIRTRAVLLIFLETIGALVKKLL